MILSGAYTCIARADEIHRRIGYTGGAFPLREFLRTEPTFELRAAPPGVLPEGADAAMRRDSAGALVLYNPRAPVQRIRFTIAHEIGHALLHHAGEHRRAPRRALPPREAKREDQADLFAAELLMPAWAIDRALPTDWREHGGAAVDFERQVRRLAALFRVSRAAMRIQLEHYLHLRETSLGLRAGAVEHLR